MTSFYVIEVPTQKRNIKVFTTVTSSPSEVDNWIGRILHIHKNKLHKLLVGLDTEWGPKQQPNGHNPVAIIQLCVGRRCLIFQFFHADTIPQSLINFLGNPTFTFVGKEVKTDGYKLNEDYGIIVKNTRDVGSYAAEIYDNNCYKKMGLKALGMVICQVYMEKKKEITMSNWAIPNLTFEQVKYACIDARVSFQLGYELSKQRIEYDVHGNTFDGEGNTIHR